VAVVSTILILGVFSYTLYNKYTIQSNTSVHKEVGVQTDSLSNTNLYKDSISKLPETTNPVLEPNILPNGLHVEAGVQVSDRLQVEAGIQTSSNPLYKMFKEWAKDLFSLNTSDFSKSQTSSDDRVKDWMANLDSSQITPPVESVVSESNFQELTFVYDIIDYPGYVNAISRPDALFRHFVVDGADQFFIIVNDVALSMDPNVMNYFF